MRKSRFFESFSLGEEVEHNLELCLKHESGEGYITDCIKTLSFFDRFILDCGSDKNSYIKEKGLTFSEFFDFSGNIEIGKDFTSEFIETMISLEQGYTGEYLQDLNNNIDYDYLNNCINYLFIPTYVYGNKTYSFFNKHYIFNMMYKYYYIPMFLSTLLCFLSDYRIIYLFNSLILYPYIFYSYSFLDVNLNSELYIKGKADRTISELNNIMSMGGNGMRYTGTIINTLNNPCLLLSRLNVMYGCEWNYRGIKFYNMTKVLYDVLLKRVVPIFFDGSFLRFLFEDKTPYANNELHLVKNKDRYSQNNLTERILSKMLSNDVFFTRLDYNFFMNSDYMFGYQNLLRSYNEVSVQDFLKYFYMFPKKLSFNSILENCPVILDNFQFKNEDISLHRFLKLFNELNIIYERNNLKYK